MRRFLAGFAILSAALGLFLGASFFLNFNSTLSDWSGFGFVWTHHVFHNFLNGRPFQESIFATASGGASVGFSHNPYAYIHTNVIHVNLTPYLLAPIWALHPTPGFIYGLIFLWNIAAGGLLTRLILKKLQASAEKTTFALVVLVGGGLLSVLDQMGQFLLLAGPILMASYYFYLARRRAAFTLAVAALCFLTEDAAMVAVCLAAYLYFFEPEGRPFAKLCAGISIPYLCLLMLVVQPAARAPLTLTAATTTETVLKHVRDSLTLSAFWTNLKSLLPALTLLPAFALAGSVWGWPARRGLWKLLALALLPAFPHWGESLAVGGAHHLAPPFFGLYLALLVMLATPSQTPAKLNSGAILAALAFLGLSLRVNAGNLPNAVKPALYRLAGKGDKAAALELSLRGEEVSNRAVIDAANGLPPEASLVYLINNRATGFIAGRKDLWQFPDFFDRADYLLVQKDAQDPLFHFDPAAGFTDNAPGERFRAMTPGMLEAVKKSVKKSHRLVRDDEHVLLLERVEKRPFYQPPETMGLGWTKNLFSPKARPPVPDRY